MGTRPLASRRYLRWVAARDVEAEHHPALSVLGDVAVCHPQSWIGDVEQDVHGLSRSNQNGVLPHEVGLRLAVTREHQEASSSVHVERMVHRMVRLYLVHEPDLHSITNGERPRDGTVLRTGLPVDEHPSHIAGLRGAVDLRHQVFPFESVAWLVMLLMSVGSIIVRGRRRCL